ncbi:MAG TPA: heme-binding domain-containing protein [Bryobacteraceae bacterium]|nr:heme-binding domain-containing protein [Bryobacteraceae bacterium]
MKLNKKAATVTAVFLVELMSPLWWPPTVEAPGELLGGAQVDARVMGILRRSCADCHSDETRYPWYSYVLPSAWLVNNDVRHGRERMNLSQWEGYPTLRKERLLSEIANQVKDRDMPLAQYAWIHRGAALSDTEVHAIFEWTQKERVRLIEQNP